ncbi:hypothetical protein CCACVL1_16136 [Corchorus capsularis]|uniref:Reverse transcriptase zinc-binding domain-containing protein n=1 Tax=Corchorus capsularis TaxID=210143 RepID=A0A1R3HZ10_COCAP|nr:hypothetical protein CCACVL1_16136 [Corchorus capsularis]
MEGSSWIRKLKIPARWVTFLWLVLRDRLHTNELRLRRGIVESGACNRCGNQLETTAHVLRDCPFERREEAGRDPLFHVSPVSDWLKDNILVSKNALTSHDFGITQSINQAIGMGGKLGTPVTAGVTPAVSVGTPAGCIVPAVTVGGITLAKTPPGHSCTPAKTPPGLGFPFLLKYHFDYKIWISSFLVDGFGFSFF